MGKLLEDVIRLAAEIHAGRAERTQFRQTLQSAEAERKRHAGEFRYRLSADRAQRAQDTLAERRAFVQGLGAEVNALKRESAIEREQLRRERARKSAQAKAERSAFVSRIRHESAVMRTGLAEQRMNEARRGREERTQTMTRIRSEIQTLRGPLRAQLRQSSLDIRRQTAEILAEGRAMQQQARENHFSITRERQRKSSEFLNRLRSEVAEMRSGIIEDMAIARRVLADPDFLVHFLETQGQAATIQKNEVRPVEPAAPAESPSVRAESTAETDADLSDVDHGPDDLTVIQGIGPGVAKRLIGAGIDSYTKLATITEEALRAALGRKMPGMDSWISQSRELVGLD